VSSAIGEVWRWTARQARRRRHRCRAASCVAVLIVIAACERPADSGEAAPPAVLDDAGRAVRLAEPAQRVASLVPAITDLIVALGAADRLVARTDYDARPELAAVPSMGGGLNPNLEWLAARRPDLVIGWADRQSRAVVGRLGELGVATYAAEIETVSDILVTARRLGTLLGREAAADSLQRAIADELARTRAVVAGRQPVRALYVVSLEPLIVAGPGTFIHQLLEAAGGRNVAGDAAAQWPHLSLEELVRRAPDAAFLALGPSGPEAAARLAAHPAWSHTPAVRSGRIFVVDADLYNRPGPDIGRVAALLAGALHPSLFLPGEATGEPERP
jgi:iron complex transport system substrate-binding protein